MSEGIIQKSIKCLANAKLNETTYEVARDIALDYITNLQQKVEQLEKENIKQKEIIENLTIMTVCGDRKQIKNTAQYKLEQLENIRKEAIEWVINHKEELHHSFDEPNWDYLLYGNATDLLNILNKGSDKE